MTVEDEFVVGAREAFKMAAFKLDRMGMDEAKAALREHFTGLAHESGMDEALKTVTSPSVYNAITNYYGDNKEGYFGALRGNVETVVPLRELPSMIADSGLSKKAFLEEAKGVLDSTELGIVMSGIDAYEEQNGPML